MKGFCLEKCEKLSGFMIKYLRTGTFVNQLHKTCPEVFYEKEIPETGKSETYDNTF